MAKAGARPSGDLLVEERSLEVGKPYFQVSLDPGAGTTLRIAVERYVNTPSYAFPWHGGEVPQP